KDALDPTGKPYMDICKPLFVHIHVACGSNMVMNGFHFDFACFGADALQSLRRKLDGHKLCFSGGGRFRLARVSGGPLGRAEGGRGVARSLFPEWRPPIPGCWAGSPP